MRRPPFRRPRRIPTRQIPNNRQVFPPKVRKANQMYKRGEYEDAAKLYEEVFLRAEERNEFFAPRLALQAGFAWLKAENKEKGIKIIKNGFGIWIERKQWKELRKGSRIGMNRLNGDGFSEEAKELENWLKEQVPDFIKDSPAWNDQTLQAKTDAKIKLPSVCPQCGAPVDPKEVEWFNDEIAQCSFCNVILNSEN